MKIAVLSDIHGNRPALEAILNDAKKQNVDEYIVLGDMITDFPATNEILDRIRDITPYVIKGNREEYLLEYERTKEDESWDSLQKHSFCYYYHTLRKDNIQYIQNLPEQLCLEFEGVAIRAVHGSPYGVSQHLYFDTPLMDQVFHELEEDILVYGHIHEEARYQKKQEKYVAQVGVVGMHNNGLNVPQYTILTCENKKIQIEFRNVTYEIEDLKKEILTSDILKEAPTWQNLCLATLLKGQDIRSNFTKDAKEAMLEKYHGKYPIGFDPNFISIDDDIYEKTAKQYKSYFIL